MFKKIVGLGFSSKGKNAKDVEKYISELVAGGATEFFTGYNPPYWHEKFGFEVSPNGRFAEHEQITDFETLKQIVSEVHKHSLEIFVNLNAWYYTNETFPLVKHMLDEFVEIGLDGIICGNISILEYVKEKNLDLKINISTIMALYNKEAINFFLQNYKINKIILSREISLSEIEKLVTAFPNTKFEVFGEGDFCRYNNGLCFAEHKYSSKDICTVVVNDLIVKKKFKPDFKKIILDETLSNEQKLEKLDDFYQNIFERIETILTSLTIFPENREDLEKELTQIVKIGKNRVDLYFDALKSLNSTHNKNILTFLKGIKYLNNPEFNDLEAELENSIKSGMKFLVENSKKLGGEAKVKGQELAKFYGRSDNLNLFTYLFFSKFENIETVKFPTRGRNYNEKLAILEEVIKLGEVPEKYLDRSISLERAHYDLTYLFGEKYWFREIIKKY